MTNRKVIIEKLLKQLNEGLITEDEFWSEVKETAVL